MWDGFDQRKFPRIQVKCTVTLKLSTHVRSIRAVTSNIGLGGICLLLDEVLERFLPVKVKLELEKGRSRLECEGHVAWSVVSRTSKGRKSLFDTGIEFKSIAPDDFSRLDYFLKRNK
jgi:hypothetical protein